MEARRTTALLSVPPAHFEIERVLYAASEAWGFGPGGNETGVILYELPREVADSIRTARGVVDPPGSGTDLSWKATPLKEPREWIEGEGALPQTGPVPMPRLHNYLNQYGFGIPVDTEVSSEIDRALSESGNFFAYTRTGVLLVMPRTRRLAFVYAG